MLLHRCVINEISLTWKGLYCMISLECGVPRTGKFTETESRREVTRIQGQGEAEVICSWVQSWG